jgi:hypothetical protein
VGPDFSLQQGFKALTYQNLGKVCVCRIEKSLILWRYMPSITIVDDVLNEFAPTVPTKILYFPPCQLCKRKVNNGFAATDGWQWSFGHARCTPNGYWMKASDFEHLAEVLDWAYHLAEKETLDFSSWFKVVEYVRPLWLAAVREVAERYFAARYEAS